MSAQIVQNDESETVKIILIPHYMKDAEAGEQVWNFSTNYTSQKYARNIKNNI